MKWIVSLRECARWRADWRADWRIGTRAALVAGFVALSAAVPARAQRVVGTVRDSATSDPIRGVVVTLTDNAGKMLVRSIADAAGRFALPRMPGAARVTAIHIGFRPRTIVLSSDLADSTLTIRMEPFVPTVDAVATTATRICLRDSTQSDALAIWDQARAALLASVVSREHDPPTIRLHSFTRRRDPQQRRVEWDSTNVKDVVVDRSFIAARPAWVFAQSGYMREATGGERTYYAPDEETLLDPSFAETHCLRIVGEDRTHRGEIGIGFSPSRAQDRDTLVDIDGVLWLDRVSPRIRSFEYTYTGLESDARGAGGELYFITTPGGVAMLERWLIHTPLIVPDPPPVADVVRRAPLPRKDRLDVRVLAYLETGGEVISARWADGSVWHGLHPRIVGSITDQKGVPMPGQRVWIMGWPDTTTSRADGRFEFPYTIRGIFVVRASDSSLARHGLSRTAPMAVRLEGVSDRVVHLTEYARDDVLSLVCPAKSYRPGTGVVIGRAITADGQPARGARIEVLAQSSADSARSNQRVAQADDDGKFVVCGASLALPLRVRATKDDLAGDARIEQWSDDVVELMVVLRKAD